MIGLPGVAIGTVISTIRAVFFGRIVLRKYLLEYKGCYSLNFVWRVALPCIICVVLVFLTSKAINDAFISFAVSTAVAFVSFFVCLVIFREKLTISYIETFLNKVRKKKE